MLTWEHGDEGRQVAVGVRYGERKVAAGDSVIAGVIELQGSRRRAETHRRDVYFMAPSGGQVTRPVAPPSVRR